jgi:uncharacterized protein YuzE
VTVTIGNLDFDRVRYDAEGDVLYLHRADPKEAVDFDGSPEGHHLRFNAAGELIGVTIINAKWLLDNEGKIVLTVPKRIEVGPEALNDAFDAASS